MVVVKFQYGNDVRRITLPDSIAYEEVLSVVKRIYGENALPRDFHLKYADKERDRIRFTILPRTRLRGSDLISID
jgi:hypothetical protein